MPTRLTTHLILWHVHNMLRVTCPILTAALLTFASAAARAESIAWVFDHQREVTGTANLRPGDVAQGHLSGQTSWDPYVTLRVPAEGIDARRFTWLTVRLYSSEQADVLDVYYQSPDKRWCLGGKFPVAKGWATYCMDLTKLRWRETATGDVSRQWGGPSKRVGSLRLDPGNQANRWVAIDYVRLETPRPDLKESVAVEPLGKGRLVALHAPATIQAGAAMDVSAELDVTPAPGTTAATVYVRLRRGDTFLRLVEQPIAFGRPRVEVRAQLPVSAYWYPGPATVEVGCYELDLERQAGAAAVEIQSDRVGKVRPPVAELRPLGGDPAIFVDGRPRAGFFYSGSSKEDYQREFGQAGIHLYADWVGPSHNGDLGHVAADRYDYAQFDRYFAAVLDVDPQAYFVPHICVTGGLWWQKAHPEELCQFADGSKGPPSFASERWRRDIGEDLRRLIAYLRRAPYADRILGYMFFNGYTAEWQMWGTWKTSRDDYSAPALRAFRAFLTKRYGTDARLRASWRDAQVTLATAGMPDWSQRRPGGPRVLRDLNTERQAIDFYEFIANMDAEALLYIARLVREATQGQSLVGTYYAYLTAHGINQQDSGHLAARRVFDSPDIDFLMSPPNYWYRKPGEACTFMSATDSFRLRGKLWLDESDHRTHLTDPGSGYGRAKDLHETLGVLWREAAETLTKRAAVSWLDMSGGWFSDPQILAAMGEARQIAQQSLPGRKPFSAEIGVFVDPTSFYYMRPTDTNAMLDLHQVVTMPQSGAPWDFLLLDDIGDPRVPDYKLYVFLNAFYVEPARRAAIQAKLAHNHATALFLYAPGYLGPQGESLAGIEQLIGIRVARDDGPGWPQIRLEPGDPLAKGLAVDKPLGNRRTAVSPVFYADDPGARVAGRLVDSRRPGLAVKQAAGWTSIYSSAMPLAQGLMRNIARSAGVHVWLDTDDALYTDGQWAGIHAATDGVKTLHLPGKYRVTDARRGKVLAERAEQVSVTLRPAETVLLRLEKQ
jgi:hypothetical protein